jgi:hypothetical protein
MPDINLWLLVHTRLLASKPGSAECVYVVMHYAPR